MYHHVLSRKNSVVNQCESTAEYSTYNNNNKENLTPSMINDPFDCSKLTISQKKNSPFHYPYPIRFPELFLQQQQLQLQKSKLGETSFLSLNQECLTEEFEEESLRKRKISNNSIPEDNYYSMNSTDLDLCDYYYYNDYANSCDDISGGRVGDGGANDRSSTELSSSTTESDNNSKLLTNPNNPNHFSQSSSMDSQHYARTSNSLSTRPSSHYHPNSHHYHPQLQFHPYNKKVSRLSPPPPPLPPPPTSGFASRWFPTVEAVVASPSSSSCSSSSSSASKSGFPLAQFPSSPQHSTEFQYQIRAKRLNHQQHQESSENSNQNNNNNSATSASTTGKSNYFFSAAAHYPSSSSSSSSTPSATNSVFQRTSSSSSSSTSASAIAAVTNSIAAQLPFSSTATVNNTANNNPLLLLNSTTTTLQNSFALSRFSNASTSGSSVASNSSNNSILKTISSGATNNNNNILTATSANKSSLDSESVAIASGTSLVEEIFDDQLQHQKKKKTKDLLNSQPQLSHQQPLNQQGHSLFSFVEDDPSFPTLTLEQKIRYERLFREIDADGNGVIDFDDLLLALERKGIKATTDNVKHIIERSDRNSDGDIDFAEFVHYCLENEKQLHIIFKNIDLNDDGILDTDELVFAFKQAGLEVDQEEALRLVKQMQQQQNQSDHVTTTTTTDASGGVQANKQLELNFDQFRDYLLLHPTDTMGNLFKSWRHGTFVDLGEDGIMPVDFNESEMRTGMWWRHLLAGGVAGAVSRTSTAPLDRLKVFLQVRGSEFNSLGTCLRHMLAEGGVISMWRGNGINVLKIAPETAMKFMAFDQMKRWIGMSKSGEITIMERFFAGSFAGAVSQTVIYPMEVLKTRFCLRSTGQYSGLMDAARKIYSNGGIKNFYRGYIPNLIGIIPYAGIDLTIYETLKKTYLKHNSLEEAPIFVCLTCGTLSSTFGQVASYPLALVRTRMQSETGTHRSSMVQMFRSIYRNEGPRGLYRGITANIMKVAPAVSISYVVYEHCRRPLGAHMS